MDEIFLGRETEQQNFIRVLNHLVSPDSESQECDLPHIFLFYGAGGIGKTTLLKKLEAIAKEEFRGQFTTIFLDWEKERDYYPGLQVGNANIEPNTILEVIFQSFTRPDWEKFFIRYNTAKKIWKRAKQKIKNALESEVENELIAQLRPLGVHGIAHLLRETQINFEDEEFDVAVKFVKSRLTKQELEVYKKPELILAPNLGSGIANLAVDKPLIIFFDTYEIVGRPQCDYILRDVIESSTGRVVWVIASRTNLVDSGWRNPEAKNALLEALREENQDPDVVAVAIRLLGNFDDALAVPELVNFLRKHPDRYVREAAGRELGEMFKQETDKQIILEQAVEPLIQVMRNNPIRDVRETARDALYKIYRQVHFFTSKPLEITSLKRALWREKDNLPIKYAESLMFERGPCPELDDLEEAIQDLEIQTSEVLKCSKELLDKPKYQKAIEKLIALLYQRNEDPDLRATIAELLGKIGSSTKEVINVLISALDAEEENDRYVRQEAAKALGNLVPSIDSINALNLSVRMDVISDVRKSAKESLTKIRGHANAQRVENLAQIATTYLQRIDREQLEPLEVNDVNDVISIFNHSSDRNRRIQAIQTLGNLSISEKYTSDISKINGLLFRALSDPDPDICAAAAGSLGNIEDCRIMEYLLKTLNHKDRIARFSVVTAISKLHTDLEQLDRMQVLESLIDIWRNDPISDVRDAVEKTLQKIYQNTRHPTAYKALTRYPDYNNFKKQSKYENQTTKDYYDQFFANYPPR